MSRSHEIRVDEVGEQIERLLDALAARDPGAADLAEQLVRRLVALYGAGLVTILERLYDVDPAAIDELAGDPLVGGLMALHDLHPVDVHDRVEAALDECRPYLGSHGGDVQLVGIDDGVVRLRLQGTCDGCGASEITLKHSVEAAVMAAAPEVAAIDVEGAVPLGEGHAPPADVARSPAYVAATSASRRSLPMFQQSAP